MTVLISNGATSLNTASGWYEVEAYNLGSYRVGANVTPTQYAAFTPAHAGNCQGAVLAIGTGSSVTDRQLVVTLQDYNTGSWVDVPGATCTLEAYEIAGAVSSGTYQYRGQYFVAFPFDTPAAITAVAGRWRIKVAYGTGTGTWGIRTSDGTNIFFAIWCDNAKTFSNGDVIICKDKVTIDKTATLGAVLGTGDTDNGTAAIVCGNQANPGVDDVALLEWENPPASSYTLSVGGGICVNGLSGIRIGKNSSATCTISNASPAVVSCAGHGLVANQLISFTTTGALPAPLDDTRGVYYYVSDASDPDEFTISATSGGAEINTTTDGSGTHTLWWGRIPTAQQAIVSFTAPTAGTAVSRIISPPVSASYNANGMASLFFYGQIPRYQRATLASDANTGQPNVVTVESVDWVNGDSVVVGRQNTQGQGVTTIHTVNSVVGTTIALTANLATNKRLATGSIVKLGGCGVYLKGVTSGLNLCYIYGLANLQLSGVQCFNVAFDNRGTTYYYFLGGWDTQYAEPYLIEDCVMWSDNTTAYYFLAPIVTPSGLTANRISAHRVTPIVLAVSAYYLGFNSGAASVDYLWQLAWYNGPLSQDAKIRLSVTHYRLENARAGSYAALMYTGINGTFEDNDFHGSAIANTYGTVGVGTCIQPASIARNTFNNCTCALAFWANANSGCVDEASVFGDITANTEDIAFVAGCYPDYCFVSPDGSLVYSDDLLMTMTVGGSVRFVDYDGTSTDDRALYSLARTQRTNAALSDTTVHTAGGSAIRFEPISAGERFEWSFDVPTGNIQGRMMAVAVWCKINAAGYYAGAYELPRLAVEYDGGTTIYDEAVASTSWQLLSVNFEPTTATGKITITLSGRTDAAGSDRYFYWDDFSILYPAGYTLNLGSMDIWDSALPVLPPIATLASALDVWTALSTVDYGANTMGDTLVDAAANAVSIKAKTDNLPSDPADQSAVEAAITAATSPLATASSIAALNDLSSAEAQSAAAAALTAYDAATGTDVTTSESNIRGADSDTLKTISDQIDGLPTDSDVQAAAAAALTAYDAATGTDVSLVAGDVDVLLSSGHGAGAWDGLTPAQTLRDAMMLAPTPGVPAAGSIDDLISDVGTAVAALNDVSSSDVQSAAAAALTAYDPPTKTELDSAVSPLATAVALATVDGIVDSILADTAAIDGRLPSDPADQSAVEAAITAATSPLATSGALALVAADVTTIKKVETGRWKITGNQMIFYDTDGTTPILTFDLLDDSGLPAMENVYERDPA